MDDQPFGDDGFLHLQLIITLPRTLLSAKVLREAFVEKYGPPLTYPRGDITWGELENCFRPYIRKIRRTRRQVERRHKIRLPASCLVLRVRRGHNADGPIVAEINEIRIHVYKRA